MVSVMFFCDLTEDIYTGTQGVLDASLILHTPTAACN